MTVLPFLATSGELHERPMGFSIGSASEGRTIQRLAANEVDEPAGEPIEMATF